jgi:hypothetical protein
VVTVVKSRVIRPSAPSQTGGKTTNTAMIVVTEISAFRNHKVNSTKLKSNLKARSVTTTTALSSIEAEATNHVAKLMKTRSVLL